MTAFGCVIAIKGEAIVFLLIRGNPKPAAITDQQQPEQLGRRARDAGLRCIGTAAPRSSSGTCRIAQGSTGDHWLPAVADPTTSADLSNKCLPSHTEPR